MENIKDKLGKSRSLNVTHAFEEPVERGRDSAIVHSEKGEFTD